MNFSIPEEYQESYPNNPKEVGESIFKLYKAKNSTCKNKLQ
jgi:hypothetical protein